MNESSSSAAASSARFDVALRDAAAAERVAAEAWDAGATGIEERSEGGSVRLLIYAPAAAIAAVRAAVRDLSIADSVGEIEAVPDTDWSEAWKLGLDVISVSPRLRIRPSFIDRPLREGQRELVIDPGQAFGTGGHHSTQLVLEWIAALADSLPRGPAVLDVGTGTGVLALASAVLADARAVAFDTDRLAIAAARDNARRNGLAERVHLYAGPIDAVPRAEFDLVLANLLKSEMLPLVSQLAAAARPAAAVVVSGLLASDAPEVCERFAGVGFGARGERSAVDANGDRWVALLMRR